MRRVNEWMWSAVTALGAAILIGIGGCGPSASSPRTLTEGSAGELEDLEWGEDRPGRAAAAARPTSQARSDRRSDTRWTILLRTFRPGDPDEAPGNFIQSCTSVEPRLAQAQIMRRGPGRIVVYGDYASAEDPRARRDLEWIQAIEFRGARLLPRAMMTRINLRHQRGEFLPNELLGIRRQYPNVHPLYTLQVEAWGDFGSGTMTLTDVQRRAEQRARELRQRGYEAYFHHDDDQVLSIVTIGLFDSGARDAQSGIDVDPRLIRLMREFPAHLLNGEPVEQLIDPRNPRRGGVVQRPTLVEVPRW